jgi:DNA topoisomerase-1
VEDAAELDRIRGLAIPPAYRDVWICRSPDGHLQATGVDDRGRKQYRYHPRFSQWSNASKFSRLIAFARRLPRIRKAAQTDMRRREVDRRKILATAVYLLDTTAIRIGNRRYARENESYGLTTLQSDHVDVQKSRVRFQFTGKSGIQRQLSLTHPSVAKVLRNCQELPGESLLSYRGEDGELHSIASQDVNEYLRQTSGAEVFAKDFRTWTGSLAALEFLLESEETGGNGRTKKQAVAAIKHAAQVLGNTPATCRKYYVHPLVIERYLEGKLRAYRPRRSRGVKSASLKPIERALLRLIERNGSS